MCLSAAKNSIQTKTCMGCRAYLEQLFLTRGQQALLWLTLEVPPVCSRYSVARSFDLPLSRHFPTIVHEHQSSPAA